MKTTTRAILGTLLASLTRLAWAAPAEPVKIGATLELSGAAADVSNDALAGLKFAVETINANGGVMGRPVALVYQDNGTSAQKAVNQASAFAKDGASLLVVASSASALAVSKNVSARMHVPTCASTSQSDDLSIKDYHPYIYTMSPNSYMVMRSVATYLAAQPHRRYAVVAADYAAGRTGARRFQEFIKELNPQAEIVVEEYPKFGSRDFTPSINKVLAAKPDYVFTMLFGSDLLTFSKQAQALGFFQQMDNRFIGMYDGLTLKAMGQGAPVGTDGFQAAAANDFSRSTAEGKQFVVSYLAKHGRYPSDWATLAYDCVAVWAQAANAAQSINPGQVMAALESHAFKSPRGELRLGKIDHQGEVPVYIGTVAQSAELGQPVIEMRQVVPGRISRPSEQAVQTMRTSD